ncbi:hypothetical protein [Mycoplasma sp. HU2014]|uniref:hypothetical protein n=1 Tax=Mycoplasma sp. HU2014 TaxID=1664275 RepID=UPI00067C6D78|nr:hypothetical protein [Mycoplasma sp. HU2014]
MKKLLLPMIGLVIGAATSGGTIYGVQTFNHKKEINEWRALLQQEKQNAQSMIKSLDEQLAAAEAKNGEIKNYIDSLNAKISKDFGLAKGVYEKAVKLTTYTVKDHEEKMSLII